MSRRLTAVAPWPRLFALSPCRIPSRLPTRRLRAPLCQHQHPSYLQTTSAGRAAVSTSSFPSLETLAQQKTPQTLTEKIVQRHAVGLPEGKVVRSGDYVSISPERCLTHDNTWPVAKKFMSIGATRIKNPEQLVFALDHDVQNRSESNLKKYEQIEAFAKTHGVDFYPAGYSIGHQVMVEELYVWPGRLCVASDSHSNMYGGLGALGFAIVRSDASSVFATGQTWFQVPPVAQVTLTGKMPMGVTGKDVIVALCGLFQSDVLNHAVEFAGSDETMASIPVDDRLTISNMSTEWSALSAMFPVDETLKRWLKYKATEAAMLPERTTRKRITHEKIDELFADPSQVQADPGAHYAKRLYLNLSTLSPYVSGPNSVKVSTPLSELAPQNIKVNKAYIVSCTNSRSSDIEAAAKVFQDAAAAGNPLKVADGVQLYIAAASSREQKIAEENGSWNTLLDAGAIPLAYALAYLASPEVVAASALNGVISGTGVYKAPENYSGVDYGYGTGLPENVESSLSAALEQLDSFIDRVETSAGGGGAPDAAGGIVPGFPEKITGEIVFCDADNLDTDNIYPGKYTYQDNMDEKAMAEVCMSNYDPSFRTIAKPNDILVSGFNFGCGSSREQAATAILAKGIPLVVSGSFGNIFSRNSINNALLVLEVPRLIERLRVTFKKSDKTPTRRTGWTLSWDVARSTVEVQEGEGGDKWEEKVGEFAQNLQEIVARGGLTHWIKHEIAKQEKDRGL
ncbi:hypothetical protein ACHAQH_003774 [Verticillium albo-atrum]